MKTKMLYFPLILFLIIFIFSTCVSAEEMYIDVSDDDCYVRGLYAATEASSGPGTNCLGFGTQDSPQTCFRTLVFFNTSVLGNAVILNATIVFRINLAWCAGGDFNVTVQRPISDEYPHMPPVKADFNRILYTGNGGEKNTSTITASYPYYFNITLNADGRSWINTDNWTKFCLRSSMDLQEAPYTYTFKVPYSHETPSERAQLYIEYTAGEEPGSNTPPNITCVYPANESTNIRRKPQCYVCVNDSDGDNLNVSFYYNKSGTWIFDHNETNVSANCTVYWNFTEADEHETLYQWRVIVNDSTNETIGNYSFTTNKESSEDKSYSRHPPDDFIKEEENGLTGQVSPPEGGILGEILGAMLGFEMIVSLIAVAMFLAVVLLFFIICRKKES